ncbi:hypothetical protein DNTS_016266 [Danionella cerebrum]|uniref:Uncharacterized protein n=1 Tax=Danionella cerebrum TaxID=2873325 RepID=A0A553Q0Z0_9TELE|nr:hypothetical protein DNTS_016266 [Danionella translucida]
MDEEEEDVFRKALHRWPSPHIQIKQTQTKAIDTMHGDQRRILYDHAGLLLLAPSSRARPPSLDIRHVERPALSMETLIGLKLQLIGDQIQQTPVTQIREILPQRNQVNLAPLWWRMALTLYALFFGHGPGGNNG